MNRQRTFSGSPWEEKAGYCRALRVGQQIFVSGTSPVAEDGSTFAPGDAYAQTQRCFDIIQAALQDLGGDLRDIVRTRLFVTDLTYWEAFAQAHSEVFNGFPPVSTMVQISGLINPDMLVEVEVEAIVTEDEPPKRPLTLSRQLQRPVDPATFPPMMPKELDEGCLD